MDIPLHLLRLASCLFWPIAKSGLMLWGQKEESVGCEETRAFHRPRARPGRLLPHVRV